MSKKVQILLTKKLVVNLGRDEHGEPKIVVLEAGLQEVDQEIADHWFVKAHAQDISPSDEACEGLRVELEAANQALSELQVQSDAAAEKITSLEKSIKEKDAAAAAAKTQSDKKISELTAQTKADATEIASLKAQLEEALKGK